MKCVPVGVHAQFILGVIILTVVALVLWLESEVHMEKRPSIREHNDTEEKPHRFLYLLQTENCIPSFLRLENALGDPSKCQCDVMILSWKTAGNDTSLSHVEYLFNSSTTFTTGRNFLFEVAMRKDEVYWYYVFMDDDVQLMMNDGTDKNPWRTFQEPAVGLLALDSKKRWLPWYYKRLKSRRCILNITNDALPVIYMDAMYNAFHYRAVKYLMPLNVQHEVKSWWYSQIPVMMKAELMFPGQIVVHTSVVSVNLKHREYNRGLKKSIL